MALPHLSTTFDGVRIHVHVKPFASSSAIRGVSEEGFLDVSVAGRLKEGEANAELCRFLAESFHIPRSSVVIESGHRSRKKTVLLKGTTLTMVEDRIHDATEEA